ncbi:MAG: class I SAM-dependent methyltransferase [Verrucomicrobiales bacterium]|nr:class I SAM-dependent methyltransferase [Verrucomicrobiales bacterium]
MAKQDNFYLETESNAFFDRWWEAQNQTAPEGLREKKKGIFEMVSKLGDVNEKRVLEIGCFIGDLLNYFRQEHQCEVHGVESSSKACNFAKTQFGLEIENATLAQSTLFNLDDATKDRFDIIICEDVLSWVSRDLIIPCLGVIDWMLKPGGRLFIRDFSPSFGFAYENHHCAGQEIYNFKQPGGHRSFFLQSGKYLEALSSIRTDCKFQGIETSRPDSMTWADSVLIKLEGNLHPVLSLNE